MSAPLPLDRARPWRDRAILATTLLTGALFLVWLAPLIAGFPLLLAGSWLLLGPWLTLLHGAAALRQAAHVSPESHPEWLRSFEAVLAEFGWDDARRPYLLIVQDPRLNATAQWWPLRPIVTVTSGLAQALAAERCDAARRAVLGHELAHARWHVLPLMWLGGPPRLPFRRALTMTTLAWSRQAEQAADRAALLAAGDLEAVVRVLILISTGVEPTDAPTIRRHFERYDDLPLKWLGRFSNLLQTHPLLSIRLNALTAWACSRHYAGIAGHERAETQRWSAAALGFQPDRAPAALLRRS